MKTENKTQECVDCVIPDGANKNAKKIDQQMCVTCPFCKQVVTAILTKDSITCPKCKASAKL